MGKKSSGTNPFHGGKRLQPAYSIHFIRSIRGDEWVNEWSDGFYTSSQLISGWYSRDKCLIACNQAKVQGTNVTIAFRLFLPSPSHFFFFNFEIIGRLLHTVAIDRWYIPSSRHLPPPQYGRKPIAMDNSQCATYIYNTKPVRWGFLYLFFSVAFITWYTGREATRPVCHMTYWAGFSGHPHHVIHRACGCTPGVSHDILGVFLWSCIDCFGPCLYQVKLMRFMVTPFVINICDVKRYA
jgi:hypothetical protein